MANKISEADIKGKLVIAGTAVKNTGSKAIEGSKYAAIYVKDKMVGAYEKLFGKKKDDA